MNAAFSWDVIHASMSMILDGNRVCGCVVMPGMPTH